MSHPLPFTTRGVAVLTPSSSALDQQTLHFPARNHNNDIGQSSQEIFQYPSWRNVQGDDKQQIEIVSAGGIF